MARCRISLQGKKKGLSLTNLTDQKERSNGKFNPLTLPPPLHQKKKNMKKKWIFIIDKDVDCSENNITESFKNRFMARNICVDEALKNLTKKISPWNKSWILYCCEAWPVFLCPVYCSPSSPVLWLSDLCLRYLLSHFPAVEIQIKKLTFSSL